jgi:spermidine synthase
MIRGGPRAWLLYLIFGCSGLSSLGCQIAWSKMFATGLGHELPATLAVVCAFMGGMGLGAWALDRRISKSATPGRWYAALELVIGGWIILSPTLVAAVNELGLQMIGLAPSALRHWTIAFGLPFLTLLPATGAMGATLPAMERFASQCSEDSRRLGAVYAANTFGAVAGTLGSAFLLVPALGLRGSIWIFGAMNLFCAATALALAGAGQGTQQESLETQGPGLSLRLRLTLFCTGLLGIGYEAIGIRVLAQVLENTIYTFAAVLAVFLFGTALGAAVYQRVLRKAKNRFLATDLLAGLACAGLIGMRILAHAEPFYRACRSAWGDVPGAVFAAELAVAGAVLLMPTLLMGALFAHLVQSAKGLHGGIGQGAALNTFGGAVAPALFGVALLPLLGSKWTLALISIGYLVLVPKLRAWRWGLPVLAFGLLVLAPTSLHVVELPPGGKLSEFREGIMASVAVLEEADRNKTLRVDNRFQMGGTAAADAQYRHAHIPLLLHPAPKRALFLGLGTGITFGAASLHPDLQSDGVELVPEVAQVLPQFEPFNFAPQQNPALHLHVADARRYVRTTSAYYDVIVADLFHPARDGAGSLYTVEHFQAVRQRLAAGGLFCQWLPLHQLDHEMLRVVIRTFLEVFPDARAFLLRFNVDAPVLGLMGSLDWPHYSSRWIETRLAEGSLQKELQKLGLGDSVRFFGTLLAGPERLREFAGNAPLNTDDQPRVNFGAPRFVYQKTATAYGRLTELLGRGPGNIPEILRLEPGAEGAEFAQRLEAYIRARDVYLRGLVETSEGRVNAALDLFVESARLSEDFTPGYAQCLTIASLEAKANPQRARALLQRLAAAQPSRPVAAEMLRRLEKN